MKDAQKKTWILEHRCRCDDAIRAIEAAKRQSASAYDARLRKISDLSEILFVKCADSTQLDLFQTEETVGTDLEQLLNAPLAQLNEDGEVAMIGKLNVLNGTITELRVKLENAEKELKAIKAKKE